MPLNERTVNAARNPKWADKEQTSIDLEVDFDELDEEYVEFNAHPNDIVSWGPDLYNRAIAGEFGDIAAYQPPADITGDDAMNDLRAWRDAQLTNVVDPIVTNPLRWDELTAEKQQEWKDYRLALLALPNNSAGCSRVWNTTADDFDWVGATIPTKPE